ncbi:ADP-ribose pyrophosphatase YjhB (NUDIX family) [Kutzneria buriramensis]|uniref:ADP-ribose pyrophosphatase YjhB (NUDIX family) n=1 Tax=Kutzneria buriramensis TaxID=1045776 RepID=A0A3E0H079_9PSEU|nr:ADP-ribose pyrophosphatase YjhB (NUDIX family) [Kutzneria buriramensis]
MLTLRFWPDDDTVHLGVAPRAHPPFLGDLALPGVLLTRGARLADDARRAVTTKLGVPTPSIAAVGQLITFDEPNRDPRGPTLSIAMWAVCTQTDADNTQTVWPPLTAVPTLAFDHTAILTHCRPLLAAKLWSDLPFTRALLGTRFSATRAVTLTAALRGERPDPGNLNRLMAGIPTLHRTPDRVRSHPTGRPAAIWTFEDEGN